MKIPISGLLDCGPRVEIELTTAEVLLNALCIVIGDYEIWRKQAAILLLQLLLPKSVYESIMQDNACYPFDRADKRVAAWRKKVLEPGDCVFCGSKKQLEAHHVIGWAEWPQGRIDVKNGLCLCHKCHTAEHRFSPAYHMMLARGG